MHHRLCGVYTPRSSVVYKGSQHCLDTPASHLLRYLFSQDRNRTYRHHRVQLSVYMPLPLQDNDITVMITKTKPTVTLIKSTKEITLNLEDIRSSPEGLERIYLQCKSLKSPSSVELWPSVELHNWRQNVTDIWTICNQFHTLLVICCRKNALLSAFFKQPSLLELFQVGQCPQKKCE